MVTPGGGGWGGAAAGGRRGWPGGAVGYARHPVTSSEGAPVDIDLVAASLRADASDVGAFVESLAAKLEEVLPGRVRVERARRGVFGPKLVRKIAVGTGAERLDLVRGDGDSVECRRATVSGGIVIKNEVLDIDMWLEAVGGALAAEAQRSAQTRQALERLLMQ